MMLRVQDAGTHKTAQSRVLVLDTVLTQQAGVVPLLAGSCSALDAYSAVLRSKESLHTNITLKSVQSQCMEKETTKKPVQTHSEFTCI